MKAIVFSVIALSLSYLSTAQTTVVLQPTPSQGKDAEIGSCPALGYDNINYGTKKDFASIAWTNSGNLSKVRSLIQFDLSSIPANAIITDAKLSFYFNPTSGEGFHSGVNASYLQRITGPWLESTVTWNNQPPTTTVGQILIPTSTANNQNYININVTGIITDMTIHPGSNYGFMLRLVNETISKKMVFASSDHITPSLRPKLEVTYTTPLPVALLSFEVKCNNSENQISWATATEINNAGFEIERSLTDDIHFEKIGTVAGNGNSSQMHQYSFTDRNIEISTSYFYRLKQIDFDGRINYSHIIQSKSFKAVTSFTAGPNPFQGNATIYYTNEEPAFVVMEVYNSSGIKVATLTQGMQAEGSHEVVFDPRAAGFSSGVYEIRLFTGGNLQTKRLICTK